MGNLTPASSFDDVLQLETTTQVLGGAGGPSNTQAQQLLNRTEYLKDLYDATLLHNAQARSGVVLTGASDSGTGAYSALSAPASNTLRLSASGGAPFVWTACGGFDTQGEVTNVRYITSNLEASTTGLPNRDFIAAVLRQPAGSPELGFFQKDLYYATPYQPTAPSTDYALWFNTATGKTYWNAGSSWFEWEAVAVGEFTKYSGSIISVYTYPYRQPFYDEETPAGALIRFAGTGAPRGGWLACDGSAVGRLRYKTLFDAIGTAYGAGDGSLTFNLPNVAGDFIKW